MGREEDCGRNKVFHLNNYNSNLCAGLISLPSRVFCNISMAFPIKRVAVIGAGPAGAITIDALTQEKKFDVIRVFERREKAGGIW